MILRNPLYWFLANLLGIGTYLAIQYSILAPRTEGYELNGIDQIAIWADFALPLLVLVSTLNIVWLARVVKQRLQEGNRQRFVEWLVVCIVCGVTIYSYGIAPHVLDIVIMIARHE